MDDIIVRIQEGLPLSVRAFTILDADCNYNVYLNGKLTYEQMRKSYAHELNHIQRGDFFSQFPAHLIEKEG